MGLLRNKRIVVTGGSKGIGRAIVDLFIKHEAQVALCCRDTNVLNKLTKKYAGQNILCRSCDVRENVQVQSFLNDVKDAFGGIDVLINNAGIGRFDCIADLSLSNWDDVFRTDLYGPFHFCRTFADFLQENSDHRGGYIINIGSLCHRTYVPGNAAYAASKAALKVLSEYLFEELREKGVFVSYLAIGSVDTTFSNRNQANAEWKIKPKDVAQFIVTLTREFFQTPKPSYCMSYCELRVRNPKKITANKD